MPLADSPPTRQQLTSLTWPFQFSVQFPVQFPVQSPTPRLNHQHQSPIPPPNHRRRRRPPSVHPGPPPSLHLPSLLLQLATGGGPQESGVGAAKCCTACCTATARAAAAACSSQGGHRRGISSRVEGTNTTPRLQLGASAQGLRQGARAHRHHLPSPPHFDLEAPDNGRYSLRAAVWSARCPTRRHTAVFGTLDAGEADNLGNASGFQQLERCKPDRGGRKSSVLEVGLLQIPATSVTSPHPLAPPFFPDMEASSGFSAPKTLVPLLKLCTPLCPCGCVCAGDNISAGGVCRHGIDDKRKGSCCCCFVAVGMRRGEFKRTPFATYDGSIYIYLRGKEPATNKPGRLPDSCFASNS